MPRTGRRGKLPRGPKGKQVQPPVPASQQIIKKKLNSGAVSPSRRSLSPNKRKKETNIPFTDLSNLNQPSDVLHSIVSSLDLSFIKDLGILKGANMESLPANKHILLDVQRKFNHLDSLLDQIIKDDVNHINNLQEKIEILTNKESKQNLSETITASQENKKPIGEGLGDLPTSPPVDETHNDLISTGITEVEVMTPIPETKSQDPPLIETVKPIDYGKDTKNDLEESSTVPQTVQPPTTSLIDSESIIETNQRPESQPATTTTTIEGTNKRLAAEEYDEDANYKKLKVEGSNDLTTPVSKPQPDLADSQLPSIQNNKQITAALSSSSVSTPSTTTVPPPATPDIPITATTTPSQNNNNIPSATPVATTPTPIATIVASEQNFDANNEPDTRVKNPKSEFVVSQTLPKAAKDLGLYTEEGLETTGEDYLKRKYNVASYPTNDLKDLLPGPIPDADFSCPKPTNQIQYNTFLTFVDNFFKSFNDDDIKFLENKFILPNTLQMEKNYDPEVTPFVIPKLGPLYTDIWKKEDSKTLGNISPLPYRDPTSILPKRSGASLDDSILETEDISCGPLLSRLLSAILQDEKDDKVNEKKSQDQPVKSEIPDDVTSPQSHNIEDLALTAQTSPANSVKDERQSALLPLHNDKYPSMMMKDIQLGGGTTNTLPNAEDWNINTINLDYPTFEERLKRELKYVGIYMNLPKNENNSYGDDPDWLTGREDDEISAELRGLQSSLKAVTKRNQKRKEILKPLLERELAWEEYSSILDDLDKQIDQAYVKRIRAPKKKKKHHGSGSGNNTHHNINGGASGNNASASQLAQQKAANSSLKALLEKRQRWISKIGPIFDKPEIMKRIPKESVFKDMDQEEDDDDAEGDVFGQASDNKEDELTEA